MKYHSTFIEISHIDAIGLILTSSFATVAADKLSPKQQNNLANWMTRGATSNDVVRQVCARFTVLDLPLVPESIIDMYDLT